MKIKQPPINNSSNGISVDQGVTSTSDKIDYPIFCFRHLHKNFGIENCLNADKSFSKQFLKKIDRVSNLSWTQIQLADKHGNGTEKISLSAIKKPIPQSLTKDVKDFLSFYFNGTNGRIIGYRNQYIFHIVFIDTDLCVYDHG